MVLALAQLLIGGPSAGGRHERGDNLLLSVRLSLSHQLHLEQVTEHQLTGGVVAQGPQQAGVHQRATAQQVLQVEALSTAAALDEAFQLE